MTYTETFNTIRDFLPEGYRDQLTEYNGFIPAHYDFIAIYRGHAVARSSRWGDWSGMGLIACPLIKVLREIDQFEHTHTN